ncbi:MAG: hypothetical protein EON49_11595 [Acidovorax sp.]|nr:MAG: hypothetical protein EON49_11595 [Acidovorax sp.]
MHDLITQLTEAIYSEPRAGRSMPARVELGPELFEEFQRAHRQAMAAVLPDVADVYPSSLLGVPIVQKDDPGATIVRLDGNLGVLILY